MQNRKRDTDVQNRILDSWEKARVGWSERIALKQVYYQGWNRSPAQVGCMRQVLRAGALGRPKGMWWGGRQEGGSGWGTHVNPWLIHVNVWQKLLQYCKVISLQLIKINEKQMKKKHGKSIEKINCMTLIIMEVLWDYDTPISTTVIPFSNEIVWKCWCHWWIVHILSSFIDLWLFSFCLSSSSYKVF